MVRKITVVISLLLASSLLLYGQDGKLRGKVTDRESGEPLVGANVIIDGTTLGAATDANGEFVILSVPPAVYSVRATFIGYTPITISSIRVSSNITTTQDFLLSTSAVQVQGIEIVAERPLIQRNTSNTVRLATQDNIKHLPFRGTENILQLQAGVIQQNGNLYIRGGRAGEVAYYVDGANVTNPYSKSQNVGVIQEAIEELQLQSGGYSAAWAVCSAP